ncbi:MAG: YIP1 family protein [Candidatus Micrarchaeota archaeon]
MDFQENIARIRDNLWLIPEKRFPDLVKDKDYTTSALYLIVCLVLSIPFMVAADVIEGIPPIDSILGIPLLLVAMLVLAYIFYGIQHVLLKLLGGKATFRESVQVFIYGATINLILGPLPFIGIVTALVMLANVVIGSAKIHKISLLRAILALLVIPIIIVVLLAVVLMLFLMPVGASITPI